MIDNLPQRMALQLVAHQALSGGQWSVCWMASITLSDQNSCMTCLAGWRRKKVFVLNLRHWRVWPDLSACASVSYQQMHGFSAEQLRNTTHLVWATGGGMVPEEEMNQYLAKGR